MSRFYGHVGGRTAGGTTSSGLSADARGWNLGGEVFMYADDIERKGPRGGYAKPLEVDKVRITLNGGTNHARVPNVAIIGTSDGKVWVYAEGECVWRNDAAKVDDIRASEADTERANRANLR